MIDPVTGWFEVTQYYDKKSMMIVDLVETTCMSRYPWSSEITYDHGSEFLGHKFKNSLIEEEYVILTKPATAGNPQAESIIKRIHQLLANLILTFDLDKNYADEDEPWKLILLAAAFSIRSTFHPPNKNHPDK